MLAPYVGTGWWTAAAEAARLLDEGGRGAEAIALVRPFVTAGERFALCDLALLLARHGQGEEAYALLLPHIADRLAARPWSRWASVWAETRRWLRCWRPGSRRAFRARGAAARNARTGTRNRPTR
ncbi:hypothetical protein [Streptomyces sp. NPDC090036]|uniref:hypothetical protein n=1 Tax=Streptomyces sp. NPDC090036 TaxID=3365926 RepID=UPI0037FBE0CF